MRSPARLGEAEERLGCDAERDVGRERAHPVDEVLEILAGEQLHHEVEIAARVVLARVEHPAEVRARDGRGRPALALEAAAHVLAGREQAGVDELDGDATARRRVLGLVDLAHPAFAQEAQELVLPVDHRARGFGRGGALVGHGGAQADATTSRGSRRGRADKAEPPDPRMGDPGKGRPLGASTLAGGAYH
jgi:hypothetical protein